MTILIAFIVAASVGLFVWWLGQFFVNYGLETGTYYLNLDRIPEGSTESPVPGFSPVTAPYVTGDDIGEPTTPGITTNVTPRSV